MHIMSVSAVAREVAVEGMAEIRHRLWAFRPMLAGRMRKPFEAQVGYASPKPPLPLCYPGDNERLNEFG